MFSIFLQALNQTTVCIKSQYIRQFVFVFLYLPSLKQYVTLSELRMLIYGTLPVLCKHVSVQMSVVQLGPGSGCIMYIIPLTGASCQDQSDMNF